MKNSDIGRRKGAYHLGLAVVEALGLEFLLFPLERVEFLEDIRVDEIGDVLAVHDLGHDVVFPLVVLEKVILCDQWSISSAQETLNFTRTLEIDVVHACTTLLGLDIALETAALRVLLIVLLAALDGERVRDRLPRELANDVRRDV